VITGAVPVCTLALASLDHADGSPLRLGRQINPVGRAHTGHEQILCRPLIPRVAVPALQSARTETRPPHLRLAAARSSRPLRTSAFPRD
jgi:hypothetical protein